MTAGHDMLWPFHTMLAVIVSVEVTPVAAGNSISTESEGKCFIPVISTVFPAAISTLAPFRLRLPEYFNII